jgi:hypothetical protein
MSTSSLILRGQADDQLSNRLKNIEDTEKAKRVLNETKGERKPQNPEAHLVATRCTSVPSFHPTAHQLGVVYQPNLRQKSDADIMRDAKLEAMGLRPEDHEQPKHKQSRMATDDVVSDNTRNDELPLIRDSRSWNVSRSACESEAPLAFNTPVPIGQAGIQARSVPTMPAPPSWELR